MTDSNHPITRHIIAYLNKRFPVPEPGQDEVRWANGVISKVEYRWYDGKAQIRCRSELWQPWRGVNAARNWRDYNAGADPGYQRILELLEAFEANGPPLATGVWYPVSEWPKTKPENFAGVVVRYDDSGNSVFCRAWPVGTQWGPAKFLLLPPVPNDS